MDESKRSKIRSILEFLNALIEVLLGKRQKSDNG